MSERVIKFSFLSTVLFLEEEMTVTHATDVIVENAPYEDEAIEAIQSLGMAAADAARYDGTGWSAWFTADLPTEH